ncbi:hypothetical protein [Kribbella sp. NBC_00889]|uniref:hypothetical protein n=1 Tax=Kribbella sp. NBC_00889 TaxID=2975974 RepID=UPI00386E22FF|nr:hypothetical protein OG817_22120 [Kribbella sp. NBC_00889]
MTERTKRVKAEAVEPVAVKVGDTIELVGNGLAVLPDHTVVTCRQRYTVQHEGRHVIGGIEYDATDPRKTEAADQADPEV